MQISSLSLISACGICLERRILEDTRGVGRGRLFRGGKGAVSLTTKPRNRQLKHGDSFLPLGHVTFDER